MDLAKAHLVLCLRDWWAGIPLSADWWSCYLLFMIVDRGWGICLCSCGGEVTLPREHSTATSKGWALWRIGVWCRRLRITGKQNLECTWQITSFNWNSNGGVGAVSVYFSDGWSRVLSELSRFLRVLMVMFLWHLFTVHTSNIAPRFLLLHVLCRRLVAKAPYSMSDMLAKDRICSNWSWWDVPNSSYKGLSVFREFSDTRAACGIIVWWFWSIAISNCFLDS